MTGRSIAVMQPYFFPYAGYFRLFAASDIFVIYDCVQFPRRGRVHRCEVQGPCEPQRWLTLPLAPCPRETLIRDLAYAGHGGAELQRRLNRLPWFAQAAGPMADDLRRCLAQAPAADVVGDLERQLRLVCRLLGLPHRILRSSSLAIPAELRGADRVIRIVKELGGTAYVNAPGGRALYDAARFAAEGIRLSFLVDYQSPYKSILPQLMREAPGEIRSSVLRQTACEAA